MASPAEIVRRWDARMAREAAAARAKKHFANDNERQEATGVLLVDGEPMSYWMPPEPRYPLYEPGKNRKDVA